MWNSLLPACVMCFRTAAAQQGERSRVLNSGILILLIPPVLILAGILLLAYWKSVAPASPASREPDAGSNRAREAGLTDVPRPL